jgi:hypothetical protein
MYPAAANFGMISGREPGVTGMRPSSSSFPGTDLADRDGNDLADIDGATARL